MFSDLEILFQGRNFIRLLEGLWVSVQIALSSMVLSIVFGTILGVIMTSSNRVITVLTQAYLQFVRIMPQLVLLFLVYFDLTRGFGINLDSKVAAVIVFTIWGTAEMGDLVRGAIKATPQHQYQSAAALGIEGVNLYRYVVLPQAVRGLIPLTINLTNRMIMTTSLVVLIGVVEVLKVAQQIIDANRFDYPGAALWIYGVVFLLYFLVCFPISLASRKLEQRWQA
ncbi:amino acid ABC transporter permease [Corynebacterium sp. 153RC1]|uniref:amino acid ABC transporter permease n=1 Tax=unclassified Corynebacterium TaxID=2624378 RepID=UPI00211C6E8B|nr:amino acid ABC transporter permease [Corynebacterium sp. 209RC1]MCQ9355205.1 amino acid ABC transporter permease [Corynebacterium sp. 1222RC1]MCQ9357392.1 amino acid ABC transporter permease [Corynebacterium sp. 122RC1]MCQ9359681.1 amino acid ABC transporter permease [Corynebacterium sp. 142RC1]MCQ9361694.1 amino acid ABC transporter permease [Corynebacterium sp. 153RC1]MCQ9363260.1 amino acid ABC transporter permease [Corynebacterium sp. 732RC1]MCQ9365835.1 amino acid ABC transporter perm